MFNSYRRAMVALISLGLLMGGGAASYQLLSASEQQHAEYRYQPSHQPRLEKPSPDQAVPTGYQPFCLNPDTNDDADLCAQWAAVDQVAEANRLSGLNLRLAVLSLWATVIGTALLLWTLVETRATARRELRAYLFVAHAEIGIGIKPHNAGKVVSAVAVTNSGSTPARQVSHWSGVAYELFAVQEGMQLPAEFEKAYRTTIPPSGQIIATRMIEQDLSETQIEAIKAGDAAIFVFGVIEYLDVFDRARRTEYRLQFTGNWPPPENVLMNFCVAGNDFT